MEYKIDIDRLRNDMKDYYGTAMVNGFSLALIDLSRMDFLSDSELVEHARNNGIDLRKYII